MGVKSALGFGKSKESSKSRQEIDQTTESNPWSVQSPWLEQGFQQAGDWLAANANPNSTRQQGWGSQLAAANQMGQLADQGMASQQFMLSTDQLYPESNPYLQANLDTIQNQLGQSLNQVNQQAAGSGMFGGSRQGVAEGEAVSLANQNIANLLMNQYNQGLQNIQNAQAQNQQVMANMALPGALQEQVGYNQQYAPMEALQNYWGIVGGNNWGGTERTTGTQTGSNSGKQSSWNAGTSFMVG